MSKKTRNPAYVFMEKLFSLPKAISSKKKQRKFGEPVGPPLTMPRVDPSQHNTQRLDQIERARKLCKRAGRKLFKPYHKMKAISEQEKDSE